MRCGRCLREQKSLELAKEASNLRGELLAVRGPDGGGRYITFAQAIAHLLCADMPSVYSQAGRRIERAERDLQAAVEDLKKCEEVVKDLRGQLREV